VSKQEHDAAVAVLRGAGRHPDRPWYRSGAGVLERHGLRGLAIDLDGPASEVDGRAAARAGAFDLAVSLTAIEHVFDSDNFLRFCVSRPGP
jgi:hypothetical protein